MQISDKRVWVLVVLLGSIGAGVFLSNQTKTAGGEALDMQIETLEQAIGASPENLEAHIALAQAYLQKVRETADNAYYTKIESVVEKAEMVDPQNAELFALRGSVALGRHQFKEGKVFIERAIALNPSRAAFYGLLGDAQIELGEYEAAVESFQKMVDIRPDFSSLSRVAYVRELYGDIPGAEEALATAIQYGSAFTENTAWAYVELGKLAMRRDLTLAKEHFSAALVLKQNFAPALEGLGKVAFFEKNYTLAEEYSKQAYEALPLAQYAINLGDIALARGDEKRAAQYFALAKVAFSAATKSGAPALLEEALFLADHDLDLPEALVKAEQAYTERPNVHAADTLAWALFKNGKTKEALTYRKKAFLLGDYDPVILFHQGIIAFESGDTALAKKYLARALEVHPVFSVQHAPRAEKVLQEL